MWVKTLSFIRRASFWTITHSNTDHLTHPNAMADVRALLKAKTKAREPQVQHHLAAYNSSGQLRCTLCATIVKFNNAAAWKAHLESKAHKANAARETDRKGKRKADDDDAMDVDGVDSDGGTAKKRKVCVPDQPSLVSTGSEWNLWQVDPSNASTPHPPNQPNGLPSDFFSDPNRTLPDTVEDYEDEEGEGPAQPPRTSATIDSEFEAFERALGQTRPPASALQDLYSRATVMAEPELVDIEALQADGFPPEVPADGANASSDTKNGVANDATVASDEPEEETEAQKARRKELEEKELILDRIVDEERAQEEAEEKVTALRTRFLAIKKQREAKKLAAAAGKKS